MTEKQTTELQLQSNTWSNWVNTNLVSNLWETRFLTPEYPFVYEDSGKQWNEKYQVWNKSLIIPDKTKNKIRQLDQIVREKGFASEILWIWLTRQVWENTEILEEFIFPDPQKTLFIASNIIFSFKWQEELYKICTCKDIEIHIEWSNIIIVWINNWATTKLVLDECSMLTSQFIYLFNFLTNQNIDPDTSREELTNIISEMSKNWKLEFKLDLECILTSTSCIPLNWFFDRVYQLSEEKWLKVNFSMHHHPIIPIASIMLRDQPYEKKQNFVNERLSFSLGDLVSMINIWIDIFEIRSLWNAKDLDNHDIVSSRFFSTQEILRISKPLEEIISKLIEWEDCNFDDIVSQILMIIEMFNLMWFPTWVIIQYYIEDIYGKRKYKDLKEEKWNRTNSINKIILNELLHIDTNHKSFPNYQNWFFKRLQTTWVLDKIKQIWNIWNSNKEVYKKMYSIDKELIWL